MHLQRFKAPAIGLVIVLLIVADIGGISHAFRMHGRRDGVIAIILPPYGWYRAAESLKEHGPVDPSVLAQSDDGRRDLSAQLTLPQSEWEALLAGIEKEKGHLYKTTLIEGGMKYAASAKVELTGPVTLTIKGPKKDDAEMTLSDSDRDQTPERLLIRKTVDGKPHSQDVALTDFQNGEDSQFLLAWSLSWATIARERGFAAP